MSKERDNSFEQVVENIQRDIEAEEEALFSKKVIKEYRAPKNVGRMTEPDAFGIVTGSCGDTMEIYLKIRDNRAADALFMTDGCGPSIACGSMLTKMVKEKDVWDIEKITNKDLVDALEGLPDENLHCAKLAVDTLKEALRSWDAKDAVDVSKNDKL